MHRSNTSNADGFSLLEVLVALLVSVILTASSFLLLQRGQRGFVRENEISDMNANARAALHRISQDVLLAGFNTPPSIAVLWHDGGGIAPDELTIVYADATVPVARPKPCSSTGRNKDEDKKNGNGKGNNGGGPCNTIGNSSVLGVDPYSMNPQPVDFETAYSDGVLLFAVQGGDTDPACEDVAPAIVAFELTQPPKCTGAGGPKSGPAGCVTLNLNHNPGMGLTGVNLPKGFDTELDPDCAVIGFFHVVQYRVNPPPPSESPALERRDASLGEPWIPVSANIENLQVQYVQGFDGVFRDEPDDVPGSDADTWVMSLRISVSGRSASRDLEGASRGVFDPLDTHLRRTFTTTVSLRNNLNHAGAYAYALGKDGWN